MGDFYEPKLENNTKKNVHTAYIQIHALRHHCCYFCKELKRERKISFAPFFTEEYGRGSLMGQAQTTCHEF